MLSPNGNRVLIPRREQGQATLWLWDLERGSEIRITPASASGVAGSVWSPDSNRIWFSMAGPEGFANYLRDIRSGNADLVEKGGLVATPASDWSRDSRFLIYTVSDPKTRADVWYVPMQSGKPAGERVKFLGTGAIESQAQFSPDSNWVAYTSNESGIFEVYIRPFPKGDSVLKVSFNGGREPRWRADGKELFFHNPSGPDRVTMLSTTIVADGSGGLRTSVPRKLFDLNASTIVPQANNFLYSPHPDGQRFLVNSTADPGEPTVNVITNWHKARK
jgi:Tol biopolymer transport system component